MNIIWGVVSKSLKDFTFAEIKEIVALAGFDRTLLSHLQQKQGSGGASKGNLISEIDKNINRFKESEKKHFLNILVEEMLTRKPKLEKELDAYLNRLGWKIYQNQVIPIEIFDISDLNDLHEKSHQDLLKAVQRFRDGDLGGALASACSAVDSVTTDIYKTYQLGNPDSVSFQEKCNKSVQTIGIADKFSELDWDDKDITPFKKNLEGSLNQYAFVMQKLRAKMSDVHGTKPILKPLVFNSIKYAEILIRMMSK